MGYHFLLQRSFPVQGSNQCLLHLVHWQVASLPLALPGKLLENLTAAAAAAESLQSCPTLCNPIDGSPPGSSLHGISQARSLEWVAISFCRGSSRPRDQTHVFCISRWISTTEPSGKPRSRVSYVIVRGTYLTFSGPVLKAGIKTAEADSF